MFKHGGNWNNGSIDGLFTANLNNDSSSSNANTGSRLLLLNVLCEIKITVSPYPLVKNLFGGIELVSLS